MYIMNEAITIVFLAAMSQHLRRTTILSVPVPTEDTHLSLIHVPLLPAQNNADNFEKTKIVSDNMNQYELNMMELSLFRQEYSTISL